MTSIKTKLTKTDILSGAHFLETFSELGKDSQKEVMKWLGIIRSGTATPELYEATMLMLLTVFQPGYLKSVTPKVTPVFTVTKLHEPKP